MINKVSIILPTFDERENIIPLIDAIIGHVSDRNFEIIVVDDDSPDLTWQLVEEKTKTEPRVKLLRRIDKRGLTSAFNDGINMAEGDVVLWLDCDFQHPPEKIPELLDTMEKGYDVVVGSRFINEQGKDHRLSNQKASGYIKLHGFLSIFLSKFTSFVLRSSFTDWTSGFIAIKKSVLEECKLIGDYGEYFMILIWQVLKSKKNYKLIEVPYVLYLREQGYSKTSGGYLNFFCKGINYLKMTFRLAFTKDVKNLYKKQKKR